MHQRGTVFWVHPIGRSPQSNAGFQKVGERGASTAKQKLKPSGSSDWTSGRGSAVRFGPARVSRSIWPSKLVLSCYRILPAKWILSFTEEVSLALCVSDGWEGVLFCRKSSLLVTFLNAAFVGGTSGLRKPENSEAPFSKTFQRGDMGG